MRALVKFLIVCGVIVGSGYASCALMFPTARLRYRLSLDVAIDGKLQTSLGVVEADYSNVSAFLNLGEGAKYRVDFYGSAITVDLGSRGLMFVVNRESPCRRESTRLAYLPVKVLGLSIPARMTELSAQIKKETNEVEVPIESLPMFVRFRDSADLNSIEHINPGDLAAAFGPGGTGSSAVETDRRADFANTSELAEIAC